MGTPVNDRDSASGISKQTPWKEPRNGSMAVGVLILSPDKRRGLYTGYWGHSCRCEAGLFVGDGGGKRETTARHLDSPGLTPQPSSIWDSRRRSIPPEEK